MWTITKNILWRTQHCEEFFGHSSLSHLPLRQPLLQLLHEKNSNVLQEISIKLSVNAFYIFLNLSFSKSCLQEPVLQILFSLTRDTSQLNSKFYQLPLYLCLWQLPRTGRLMSCDISSFHHCSGSEMIK